MAFSRRRLIADRIRRKPSIRHEREPNTPLPLPGCQCDQCENAREDDHWSRVGELLGIDEPTDEKGDNQ